MDAKELLSHYHTYKHRAEMFKEEYEEEIELIDSIRSSANIDGLPRQKFINRDTESRAIRLTEKLERMQNAIIEAVEVRQRVFEIVSEIPDVYGIVLSKRYIQEKQWCDIAEEMNFSEEYLRGSLHKKALKMMQDALDNRS